MNNRRFLKYGVLFPALIFAAIYCCKNKPAEKEKVYASLIDSTTYIGIEACKQCHADKYETFRHTGMGMSFDRATKRKSSGEFDSHQTVFDKYKDLHYFPYWSGDSLFIDEFRLSGKDTIFKRTEKVSYIVGSGQHTNSHMININNYVYQAPLTFYTQKQQWDLPPGFEGGFNSRFNRMIELECMSCHNGYPKIVKGSMNKFEGIPSGIDCERCHGPGSKHVADKLAGKIVDVKNQIDYSIVNPAKLPIDYQLDICQRCHIQGNAVLKNDKSFFDFRAGMRLSEVMDVYMPVYKGDNKSHIMASHAERMKMSKCFTASISLAEKLNKEHPSLEPYKNAMTCVTCHDPHVSVRQTDPQVFVKTCNSCHTESTDDNKLYCSASVQHRRRENNNCINCHMPKSGAIDIPHVSVTDHWIHRPIGKEEKEKVREFVTLACINNPQSDKKSRGKAFVSYYEKFVSNPAFLDSALNYFSSSNTDELKKNLNDLIRIYFLRNDYAKVISLINESGSALKTLNRTSFSNDDAWTSYRIGESYAAMNQYRSALDYYTKAVELAPFIPYFRLKLASLQDDNGMVKEAKANYEFLIRENPKMATPYVNYGFLLASKENNFEKADQMYSKALSYDPDNLQALINKAGVYALKGQKGEAKLLLLRALKLKPDHPQAKMMMQALNKR